MHILCGLTALFMYLMASDYAPQEYIAYHSLWHCFIFTTAGFGALLRYSLDEKLYPMINRRDHLDSI